MRDARRGSPEAAEELVARHWDGAHRIAYGILGDAHAAEDVAQEAMLAVLEGIGRFDARRPLGPWLHRIVTNRALDRLRARRRRAEVPAEGALEAGADAARATAAPFASDSADADLRAALETLSPESRAIVVLRHIGGYGPGEIGRLLGMPRGTVGSRLRRALDQLQTEMEDGDG